MISKDIDIVLSVYSYNYAISISCDFSESHTMQALLFFSACTIEMLGMPGSGDEASYGDLLVIVAVLVPAVVKVVVILSHELIRAVTCTVYN